VRPSVRTRSGERPGTPRRYTETYAARERTPRGDRCTDREQTVFDARDLPPPEPLKRTLERLAEMDDGLVLVQLNDRVPQHLYPKLTDRGYEYETTETDDVTPGQLVRCSGEREISPRATEPSVAVVVLAPTDASEE
jgi:uncharacterized protein (DUF2249 family)